ncbi:hypothetical protein BKA67DRAFT_556153 [Truncatella angustata]|uniref:Uncharacterized protein n=1 Tax=Truncatella angustata TaxID=152316 RepID=A0A9P8UTE3_9PEZI|nr:uncharacterized protein BKA67DRAFT_556153 [Truncatella angustata]KAH6657727.1 hypothetical protein BKA67DRAFT_556153 [Truncatella angustata]
MYKSTITYDISPITNFVTITINQLEKEGRISGSTTVVTVTEAGNTVTVFYTTTVAADTSPGPASAPPSSLISPDPATTEDLTSLASTRTHWTTITITRPSFTSVATTTESPTARLSPEPSGSSSAVPSILTTPENTAAPASPPAYATFTSLVASGELTSTLSQAKF